MVGMPLGEIALLVAAVVDAGVATGILAGLFGIGGGAIIVPVLYEMFRILGVPEEVRMHLCVGTSMAIIIPTTIRSYLTLPPFSIGYVSLTSQPSSRLRKLMPSRLVRSWPGRLFLTLATARGEQDRAATNA